MPLRVGHRRNRAAVIPLNVRRCLQNCYCDHLPRRSAGGGTDVALRAVLRLHPHYRLPLTTAFPYARCNISLPNLNTGDSPRAAQCYARCTRRIACQCLPFFSPAYILSFFALFSHSIPAYLIASHAHASRMSLPDDSSTAATAVVVAGSVPGELRPLPPLDANAAWNAARNKFSPSTTRTRLGMRIH